MEKSPERIAILEKIEEYERLGLFDRDVEDDPATRTLRAGEVDYAHKKLKSKIASKIANGVARRYFDGCIKRGELVVKEVRGLENYAAVKDEGVIVTCNHFSIYDHYAVYKALEPKMDGRMLYKIIREGNYTSFKGLFGYFFRNCNTLPLSSNPTVMREMYAGVKELLKRGETILIYPEQSLWWNYRKPKPLKLGAFKFAVTCDAPVVPIFITMEDTDKLDASGFPIQAYTLHVLPAMRPSKELLRHERAARLADENYRLWKEVYESVYGKKLVYSTISEVNPWYST